MGLTQLSHGVRKAACLPGLQGESIALPTEVAGRIQPPATARTEGAISLRAITGEQVAFRSHPHSLTRGPLPPPSKPICSILLQSSLPSSVSNPLLPPPRKDPPDHREDHLDSPGASTHLRILKLITSATHPLPRKLTWLQTPGIQAWIFLWLLLSQLPSQELKTKS